MKGVARAYIWWPGLDDQIEGMIRTCDPCMRIQDSPSLAPLHPWVLASNQRERVHVDYAEPFEGQTYMVAVDAFSKWPEMFMMSSIMSEKTIAVLRTRFSRTGIPQILVSDNEAQLISSEFLNFVVYFLPPVLPTPYFLSPVL